MMNYKFDIIIKGGGAHNYFPNLGLLSILGGAMANLCLVLQAEHKDKPVRINNVSYNGVYIYTCNCFSL